MIIFLVTAHPILLHDVYFVMGFVAMLIGLIEGILYGT